MAGFRVGEGETGSYIPLKMGVREGAHSSLAAG